MIQRPASTTPIPPGPGVPAPGIPADTLRSTYRGLRAIGLSDSEAGSLSAHLAGLAPVHGGWQFREIERLLFIRSLVESGRIRS